MRHESETPAGYEADDPQDASRYGARPGASWQVVAWAASLTAAVLLAAGGLAWL